MGLLTVFFAGHLSEVRSMPKYGILVNLRNTFNQLGRKTTLEAEWDKLINPGMGADATWSAAVEVERDMGGSHVTEIYHRIIYVAVHHACGLVSL